MIEATMEALRRVAETILAEHFGMSLVLHAEPLRDDVKSTVIRCRLDPAHGAPASVIVKRSKCGGNLDDWAAARFLSSLDHDPPLAPRCYGGNAREHVVALEDLGPGDRPTSLDILRGIDPDAAAETLLEGDYRRGSSTLRQQLIAWLDAVTRIAERHDRQPARKNGACVFAPPPAAEPDDPVCPLAPCGDVSDPQATA